MRIWVVPGCYCNDDIHKDQKPPFKIIGFAIPEKVTDYHDRKNQQDDHEYFKVEIHLFVQSPADNDN